MEKYRYYEVIKFADTITNVLCILQALRFSVYECFRLCSDCQYRKFIVHFMRILQIFSGGSAYRNTALVLIQNLGFKDQIISVDKNKKECYVNMDPESLY